MTRRFEKRVTAHFALASLALLAAGCAALFSLASTIRTAQGVEQTHELLYVLEQILTSITDAETGQRGYLLTGRDQYLEPYESALRRLDTHIAKLDTLAGENSGRKREVDRLLELVNARLVALRQTIRVQAAEGRDKAMRGLVTDQNKNLMDDVRSHFNRLKARESS
jgi:CHASE3 domain sensor protein